MSDSAAALSEPADRPAGQVPPQSSLARLTLLAIGLVHGDIGTADSATRVAGTALIAESAMEFFKLPPNRVVELGAQVEI